MSDEKKTKKPAAKKADDAVAKEAKKTAKPAAKKDDAKAAKSEPKAKAEAKAEKPAKAEKAAAEKPTKKPAAKRDKKAESGVKKQGKLIDDIRLYDVIQRPVITEKATMFAEQNKVVFRISPTADKSDVKRAVEALFGVNVTKVNTISVKGKAKRFRGRNGQRSDFRKAVVTLKEGQSIDIAAGLK
jgi:large subunit ribosomal protein L23